MSTETRETEKRAEARVSDRKWSSTIGQLIADSQARLAAAGCETPCLDAEVLISAAVGLDRAGIYAHQERTFSRDEMSRAEGMIARRAGGEPVAYIVGKKEFWSLDFEVNVDVLIPRPETELLVEVACELLPRDVPSAVCDVGTGSGCVAVAIAKERPLAEVVATDISRAALRVAERNVLRYGLASRVRLVHADLFEAVPSARRFDLVVSNPPYVSDGDDLPREVRHEPRLALRAGQDGLDVIRRLVAETPRRLRKNGYLAFEFGFRQEESIRGLLAAAGFQDVKMRKDLAGIPRVALCRLV